MTRRRVLTVVDGPDIGDVASHLISSMGRISRSRFDLRVANLGPPAPLSERLRDMKVRVYDLGIDGPFAFPRRVLALRKLVRSVSVDLVHSYGRAGPTARLGSGGAAVVSTLPDPHGAGSGPGARLQAFLERFTASRAARLLAPDEAVRRHYAEAWERPVELLPTFLDIPGFRERLAATPRPQARTRLGVGPDDVVLLHVDRGGHGRGLETLLEAFRVAHVENPALRLFLTGDEKGMGGARATAGSLAVGDAVVFLGPVEDVAPLYAAADLFLLPSHREGTALLEAMSAGLPTVAGGDGGIADLAGEDAALRVETDRPEALARGILALASDPERRAALGRAAADRAAAWDVARWAPRLERLYADVLGLAESP